MEKKFRKDFLILWRELRKYKASDVDAALEYPEGTIQIFELYGFAKVPARELIKILYFYRVPLRHVYKAIEITQRRVRSK